MACALRPCARAGPLRSFLRRTYLVYLRQMNPSYDIVVVGGGNAALCAALEARRAGCTVLILEAAPKYLRGGNSRHTRNVRHVHKGPVNQLVGDYLEEEFYKDLLQVTGGETNE